MKKKRKGKREKKIYCLRYNEFLQDTAGQERFRSLTRDYYRRANGAVFVFDITDRSTLEGIRPWIASLHSNSSDDIPFILIGSKCDLRESYDQSRLVPFEQGKALADEYGVPYFETSVITNIGVENAYRTLVNRIVGKRLQSGAIEQEGVLSLENSREESKFCCV